MKENLQRQKLAETSRSDAFRKVLVADIDAETRQKAHEWLEHEVLSRAVMALEMGLEPAVPAPARRPVSSSRGAQTQPRVIMSHVLGPPVAVPPPVHDPEEQDKIAKEAQKAIARDLKRTLHSVSPTVHVKAA